MRNKAVWIVLGVVVVAIIAIVAVQQTRQPKEKEIIRVGAILPLTGSAASFGEVAKAGIDFGIEEIRGNRSINVEVFFEDSEANPQKAISSFRKLVYANKVDCIIATVYAVGMALRSEAEKSKTALLATVVAPEFTKGTNYVLRHAPLITDDVRLVKETVVETKLVDKQVAVVYQTDDYGRTFLEILGKELRPKLAEGVDPKTTDFRSLVTKIRANNPNLVVVVGFGQWIGLLIKQLREQGYTGEIHASAGFMLTDAYLSAGDYAKGIWFNDLMIDEQSEKYIRFKEKFSSRFGRRLSKASILFYNWVMLIQECANHNKTTSDDMVEFLKSLGKYDTGIMKLSIDKNGEIVTPLIRRRFE
ncbi:MAG: ABC transporter substrate-binding protein [Nitrososphaerota archaeon]